MERLGVYKIMADFIVSGLEQMGNQDGGVVTIMLSPEDLLVCNSRGNQKNLVIPIFSFPRLVWAIAQNPILATYRKKLIIMPENTLGEIGKSFVHNLQDNAYAFETISYDYIYDNKHLVLVDYDKMERNGEVYNLTLGDKTTKILTKYTSKDRIEVIKNNEINKVLVEF